MIRRIINIDEESVTVAVLVQMPVTRVRLQW